MARNSLDNQGANVSIGGDPSSQLYQFAAGGGGFTRLQQDPRSLSGAAGEALANTQILQEATQTIGNAVTTGLNIYTDEKARQFKIKMLDTLQNTERGLINVTDPTQHKEVYQKTLDGLKMGLSESGIIKKEDLDSINKVINNQASHYEETNFKLKLEKTGNDSQENIQKIWSTVDSVQMNDDNILHLIDESYQTTYDTLKNGGWSDEQSKKLATQNMMKTTLFALNSKTNIEFDKTLKTYLSAKDGNGEYIHLKPIQGEDRIDLSRKRTDISAQNDINDITLGHAKGRTYGIKYIESKEDIDPIRRARLIEADRSLGERRSKEMSSQYTSDYLDQKEIWRGSESEIYNTIMTDESIDRIAESTGQNPEVIKSQMLGKALKLREDYTKDPKEYLRKNPRYATQPIDVLINIQKQTGISNPRVLSNREEQVYTDLYNRAKTPEEKLQVANFTHPESSVLMQTFGASDPEQQKQFVEKYKYNILANISDKQISPKTKVAFEIMARNTDENPNAVNIARNLIAQEDINNSERIPPSLGREDIKSFNNTPLMRKLSSNLDTKSMADTYRRAYETSGVGKNDFINAINLDVIDSGNKDILFEKNILDRKYVQQTLDGFTYDDNSFPEELRNNKAEMIALRSHGEWRNDGQDGFKYVYNGVPYIIVNVDKQNKTLEMAKKSYEDNTSGAIDINNTVV